MKGRNYKTSVQGQEEDRSCQLQTSMSPILHGEGRGEDYGGPDGDLPEIKTPDVKSCQTALTELDSFVCKERNAGYDVRHVGTDQSGAYNCADHDIFLGKMEMLCFGDSTLKLMKSYLNGRVTRVKIEDHVSDPISLSAGFPEGSCLSCFNWLVNIIDAKVVSTLIEMDLNGPESVSHFQGLSPLSTARTLLPPAFNTLRVMYNTNFAASLKPRKFSTLAILYSDDISSLVAGKGEDNILSF